MPALKRRKLKIAPINKLTHKNFLVLIFIRSNSLAPKFASGGNNLKIIGLLCIMCLVSASVITIVPMIADQIFTIA